MKTVLKKLGLISIVAMLSACNAQTPKAENTPFFFDDFERQESQELVDEVGKNWTTSSDTRAAGNKQVDLRDGALYIYRHAVGDHSVSVRQEAGFANGEIRLKFKFDTPKSNIKVNVADMTDETVHAGHLLYVNVKPTVLHFQDHKFGIMQWDVWQRHKVGKSTQAERDQAKARGKRVRHKLALNEWHDLSLTFKGEMITASINGEAPSSFSSPGFGHPKKGLIRLLVDKSVYIDDVAFYSHD